jgi:hypothetical protein
LVIGRIAHGSGTRVAGARISPAVTGRPPSRRHAAKPTTWWRRHGDLAVLLVFVGVIVFTGFAPPEG